MVFFGWSLMIYCKILETWENGAFWLAEMGGHMTFEWDLIKMWMTPLTYIVHIKLLSADRRDQGLSKISIRLKIRPLLRKLQAFKVQSLCADAIDSHTKDLLTGSYIHSWKQVTSALHMCQKMSNVKKSNTLTIDEVHKKITWHNEVQTQWGQFWGKICGSSKMFKHKFCELFEGFQWPLYVMSKWTSLSVNLIVSS